MFRVLDNKEVKVQCNEDFYRMMHFAAIHNFRTLLNCCFPYARKDLSQQRNPDDIKEILLQAIAVRNVEALAGYRYWFDGLAMYNGHDLHGFIQELIKAEEPLQIIEPWLQIYFFGKSMEENHKEKSIFIKYKNRSFFEPAYDSLPLVSLLLSHRDGLTDVEVYVGILYIRYPNQYSHEHGWGDPNNTPIGRFLGRVLENLGRYMPKELISSLKHFDMRTQPESEDLFYLQHLTYENLVSSLTHYGNPRMVADLFWGIILKFQIYMQQASIASQMQTMGPLLGEYLPTVLSQLTISYLDIPIDYERLDQISVASHLLKRQQLNQQPTENAAIDEDANESKTVKVASLKPLKRKPQTIKITSIQNHLSENMCQQFIEKLQQAMKQDAKDYLATTSGLYSIFFKSETRTAVNNLNKQLETDNPHEISRIARDLLHNPPVLAKVPFLHSETVIKEFIKDQYQQDENFRVSTLDSNPWMYLELSKIILWKADHYFWQSKLQQATESKQQPRAK